MMALLVLLASGRLRPGRGSYGVLRRSSFKRGGSSMRTQKPLVSTTGAQISHLGLGIWGWCLHQVPKLMI